MQPHEPPTHRKNKGVRCSARAGTPPSAHAEPVRLRDAMGLRRTHLATAACTAGTALALVWPFRAYGLAVTGPSVLAVVLLAMPFIVFTGATRVLARRRTAGLLLVLLFLLAFVPWYVCLILMAWFQPGLVGAAVLGGLMGLAALVLARLVHFATRSKAVPGAAPGRA
jgi:hypothetical protein